MCGHQFVVTNYNDKGDPATSLGIARQIVAQGNTIIMEDSLSSAQNQDQPYLMQQHVLVVNGDGANALFNAQQNPTAFSTLPSNAQYAQLMVNWAKSHGDNNIGILSDGTSFSDGTGDRRPGGRQGRRADLRQDHHLFAHRDRPDHPADPGQGVPESRRCSRPGSPASRP